MGQPVATPNEIRLFLLDRPEFNTLINGVKWTDEMINQAIIYTIDKFNISNPPVLNGGFTVETFPSKYLLLIGVTSYLLRSSAIGDINNFFNYTADGVTISDRDRGQLFLSAAQTFADEFNQTTQNIKTNLNLAGCYGNVSSEYRNRAYV